MLSTTKSDGDTLSTGCHNTADQGTIHLVILWPFFVVSEKFPLMFAEYLVWIILERAPCFSLTVDTSCVSNAYRGMWPVFLQTNARLRSMEASQYDRESWKQPSTECGIVAHLGPMSADVRWLGDNLHN